MRFDLTGSTLVRALALTAAVVLPLAGCGSTPPTSPGPSVTTLTVSSISPSNGGIGGGTTVTILGTAFGTDVTVTIGGTAATNVTRVSSTSLTAVTPAKTAGAAAVIVTTGGQSATASTGFMFIAPSGANQAPAISSIRSIGTRSNQASGFGDIGETVTLSATVTDVETLASALTFAWSVPQGTISGTTANATWVLPATLPTTPTTVTATLTVTERYTENGLQQENVSVRTFGMSVHNSQKEILDLGQDFLDRFSQSSYSATEVTHGFSQTCDDGDGYDAEIDDVEFHREHYVMLPGWSVTKVPPATFNFGGLCALRSRPADACARFSVQWFDRLIKTDPRDPTRPVGSTGQTQGIDYVTAVLESDRWRLCHSDYIANEAPAFLTGWAKSLYLRRGGGFGPVSKSLIKK